LTDIATDAVRHNKDPASAVAPAVVGLTQIIKSYGATIANANVDLVVHACDVIGLIRGNGAGKSTLMRILCGGTAPTLGDIAFDGEAVDFSTYNTTEAQRSGVRMVHQELSLCTNLSVAENFFIEAPQGAGLMPGWRNRYRLSARQALDAVFPDHGIDVDTRVGALTIGERQMVEIARAVATPGVRLIILDGPTSSLDQERSRQLRSYVQQTVRAGVAFIFISHKLQEIIDVASQVMVLRNGATAWRGAVDDVSIEQLVGLMGAAPRPSAPAGAIRPPAIIRPW
jgi:ribose transport system ATP-binding protein